jgi:transposase-like protein
LKVCN